MKLPDSKEFINYWPKSLAILQEKVLSFFLRHNIQIDNIWFPDIDIVIPISLKGHKNIQIVFFGGFLERFFESGNWPNKNFKFWCLSSKVQMVLIDLLKLPADSINVIPRYQLFEKNQFLKYCDLKQDVQIVYSGRLSSQKNIEMVLAFGEILKEKIHKKVEILLLGEWDNLAPKNRGRYQINSYQKIVEKFQSNLKIKQSVSFIHHLNYEEWLNQLSSNCILVNFSNFVCEDFGVSIAQAQQLGIPIILSKWGGHCDVQGDNILWVDNNDIGESFSLEECVLLKAQIVVEKYWGQKLSRALDLENGDKLIQLTETRYLSLVELHCLRLKAIEEYGNEMLLLGQDRMSLFASTESGKNFFKKYALIFSGNYKVT